MTVTKYLLYIGFFYPLAMLAGFVLNVLGAFEKPIDDIEILEIPLLFSMLSYYAAVIGCLWSIADSESIVGGKLRNVILVLIPYIGPFFYCREVEQDSIQK